MEGDPYYDIGTGLEYLFGAYTPEGTFHGIWGCNRSATPVSDRLAEKGAFEGYWRFTDLSARKLFETSFGAENVSIDLHGNVLSACAFLYCLGADELTSEELDHYEDGYQVTIGVRAVKPTTA
jgi:hypothetical protein